VQDLKIEFLNSSLAQVGAVTTRVNDVGEVWTQKVVSGVAPAGTAWARFVVGVSGSGSQGALQFDDAVLCAP